MLLCLTPLQEQLLWCVLWSNSVTREAHISNVRHHPWCRHRRGLFFVVAAVHEVIEAGVTHVYMHASRPNRPIRQHPLSHARLFVPCVFVLCCCMKFCSSFCDAGGVFGVCAAMASDWNREDFFNLAPGDIHKLKIQLAQHCEIHYSACCQDKDMGASSNGVVGLTAEKLQNSAKAMQVMMSDTALSTPGKSFKLQQEYTFATIISGCHVKWATTTVLNKGYIMEAGTKMVASWDPSVERRVVSTLKCCPMRKSSRCRT